MKTLKFHKPVSLCQESFDTDVWSYRFPFSIVETSLLGSPEEKSRTQQYVVTIGLSRELRVNWRVGEVDESELVKLLFEFGKRHVFEKLQHGSLTEEEELLLTTQNSPQECPFEISRIADPEGASFDVEVDQDKANDKAKHNSSNTFSLLLTFFLSVQSVSSTASWRSFSFFKTMEEATANQPF